MGNVYEGMNVRQKLARARLYFLNQKIQKSGKNIKLEFKYFELDDIVPPAIRIFARVGLITETKISGDSASMIVYNADNDDDFMEFTIPYRENDPIMNREGKAVTNNLQALGASITYLRRYLWMIVLDVTEPDTVDASLGSKDESEGTVKEEDTGVVNIAKTAHVEEKKPTKPATVEERKEIKEKIMASDQANDKQIALLKKCFKRLMELDDNQADFINEVIIKTNHFKELKAAACESLTENVKRMITEYEKALSEADNG